MAKIKDDAELHPEKRDIMVGFKMTETEKADLEAYCFNRDIKMSVFLRHAVKTAMKK